jgi:hypothetical protein
VEIGDIGCEMDTSLKGYQCKKSSGEGFKNGHQRNLNALESKL